jgi:hypothetical protein
MRVIFMWFLFPAMRRQRTQSPAQECRLARLVASEGDTKRENAHVASAVQHPSIDLNSKRHEPSPLGSTDGRMVDPRVPLVTLAAIR